MAHIQRRGERGNYRYKVRYLNPDGREQSRTFVRRADAETFLTSVTSDILRGQYVDPRAGRVRFADYAQEWLDRQSFAPSTREAVQSRFAAHVYPVLGSRMISEIRPSVAQSWATGMSRKSGAQLAPATVRVIMANVSSVLTAAVDDGIIASNPFASSAMRATRKAASRQIAAKTIEVWSDERVQAVLDALAGAAPRYHAVAVLAAESGLRQGEVLGLTRENVDWLRGLIHVRQQLLQVKGRIVLGPPKYDKERTVPLTTRAKVALSAHMAAYPPIAAVLPWRELTGPARVANLIFSTRERRPVNRNTFNAVTWKPALERAGVPPTRANGMHALRHAWASSLVDAGVNIKTVAGYLGHADAAFTLRVYVHPMATDDEAARGALERALRGRRPADGLSQIKARSTR